MRRLLGHPAVPVAVVRIVGAVLLVVSVVGGVRVLGPDQFGTSVILIGAGQLLALPVSSLERLALRLAATRQEGELDALLHLNRRFIIAVSIGTAVACFLGPSLARVGALEVAAVGTTAVMVAHVTLRQAVCRGHGLAMWGQVPNEIVRTVATIVSYAVCWAILPESNWAEVSTILVAVTTSTWMQLAPRRAQVATRAAHHLTISTSMFSLFLVSLVAALIERGYPIATGAFGSAAAVATLAVGLRLIQAGLFGQALALFFYSPAVAAALAGHDAIAKPVRPLLRRIRIVSIACASPIVVFLLVAPERVVAVFGSGLPLEPTFPLVALAIVAQTATGPSQALLIMSGNESSVARSYLIASIVGLAAYALLRPSSALEALVAIAVTYAVAAGAQLFETRRIFGSLY